MREAHGRVRGLVRHGLSGEQATPHPNEFDADGGDALSHKGRGLSRRHRLRRIRDHALVLQTNQIADALHHSRGALRPGDACLSRASSMTRAQGRPGADRTHGPRAAKSTRQNHRHGPDHPAFAARLALRLIRALPGDRRSCPRHPRCSSTSIANLASATGGQDHTTSPSAPCRSSACEAHAATCRGHRIPCPTFVTTRTSLIRTGTRAA